MNDRFSKLEHRRNGRKQLLFTILAFSILFFMKPIIGASQSWGYSSGGNAFDGKYRTATVRGSGGKFPYENPLLVVNSFEESRSINIYVADAGYAGCDNKVALINFDDTDNIFSFPVTSNSDNEVWFLNTDDGDLTEGSLLRKLMSHSYVFVRLRSDCGQSDYRFSLQGSSKAINSVAGKALKEETEMLKDLKAQGQTSAITQYRASIYLEPGTTISQVLEEGERVIISKDSPYDGFYNLISTQSMALDQKKDYYIKAKSVRLIK